MKEKLKISHLEWHISHACNFTCESCCHFSNHKFTGDISIDEISNWYKLWNHRIEPDTIDILGGEPLLNKSIYEIIKITRESWKFSKIDITTNGVLLYKYPKLPEYLQEYDIGLKISKHGTNTEYNKIWNSIVDQVQTWKKQYNIAVNFWQSDQVWFRLYKGFGNNIEPYDDRNPQESWNNCITGQDCWQLYEGNIYKCAPLAYLPMLSKKYKISNKWDYYLTYKPLTPDCTDEELEEFFNRKAESYCAMCPKQPQKFLRKNDPRASINIYMEKND